MKGGLDGILDDDSSASSSGDSSYDESDTSEAHHHGHHHQPHQIQQLNPKQQQQHHQQQQHTNLAHMYQQQQQHTQQYEANPNQLLILNSIENNLNQIHKETNPATMAAQNANSEYAEMNKNSNNATNINANANTNNNENEANPYASPINMLMNQVAQTPAALKPVQASNFGDFRNPAPPPPLQGHHLAQYSTPASNQAPPLSQQMLQATLIPTIAEDKQMFRHRANLNSMQQQQQQIQQQMQLQMQTPKDQKLVAQNQPPNYQIGNNMNDNDQTRLG